MAMFAENQSARVFHVMMILPAGVLLMILSVVSLSTLAATNKRFVDKYNDDDVTCILYAERESNEVVDYSEGEQCTFSIVGGAMLALLAFVFIGVLVAKAIVGIGVLSIFSMIELVLSALGTVWAFIVSVVITAGLNQTCSAFAEAFKDNNADKFPCCSYSVGTSESRVFFYEGINSSRITAWFAMVLLLFLTILYLCIVIKYFTGGRTGGGGMPTKTAGDSKPI